MDKSGNNRVYRFEKFRLDGPHRMLYRDGEQLALAPKAVETLLALVEQRGEIVSKSDLMESIWSDAIVEESNLSQYLYVLRKTLGKNENGEPFIETFRRRGYRFNGEVTVEGPSIAAVPAPLRAVRVERSDNIHSLAEWRKAHVLEPAPAALPVQRSKWFLPIILIAVIFGASGLLFGVYKMTASRPTRSESNEIPFRGKDIRGLTTSGRSRHVAISPDGRYIAHIDDGPEGDSISVRLVSAANDVRIAGPTKSELASVTFSPDGNSVVYASLDRDKGEVEVYTTPLLGGPPVKLLQDAGPVSFSPDGSKLAFMLMNQSESMLIVANADGTQRYKLASRNEPEYLSMFWVAPVWSPDGKFIACPIRRSDDRGRYETIIGINVADGSERWLTDMRWQRLGQPRMTSGGIMVTAAENIADPKQIWYVSLPDGVATRVTHDLNNYDDVCLTNDSNLLSAIQIHTVSSLWIAPADDPATAKQVLSEIGWLDDFAWLPEGRIAYLSHAGGGNDLWIINADGSNAKQVTTEANASVGLSASPDGRSIYFGSERNRRSNIWRIGTDGSDLTQITFGEGEFRPAVSRDGRSIVYQNGENYPTLWKMSFDGREPVRLTSRTGAQASISPDGRTVAYYYLDSTLDRSRWGIGINDIDGKALLKRFDFPATVARRFVRWTPDGKSVAFINSPDGVPNIWLQPINGGEQKPLTNFRTMNISAFGWSNDGKSLAIACTNETREVVLINY